MQYKWAALTVTTVGTIMASINTRILIIGLPTVAKQLSATPQEAVWLLQSVSLASTVSVLLIGRISDLYGRVKLFNIGFVVFTIGALLASLAPNIFFLIGFLLIQGVGGAIITGNSAAIITDASPQDQLGLLLGINQTAFRAGAIIGLTLSGIILSVVDWRGLFYVNIPIGIFGAVWASRILREISVKDPIKKMDWPGFVLFSIGLTLALLGVTLLTNAASSLYQGIALITSGVAILVGFAQLELRATAPLMDFRLFKIRLFTMGNVAQILYSSSWGGVLVLLAFYLQIGLGFTPLHAGIDVVVLEVTYLPASLLAARLSDRYGSRILCTSGLGAGGAGLLLLSTFGAGTPLTTIFFDMVIIGIGSGLFVSPNIRAIMSSVPANRRGVASGLFSTAFATGSTTGNGLAILFITFGISYASFSSLLQGTAGTTSSLIVLRQDFLNGFRIAALIFALVQFVAIIPSISRGSVEEGLVKTRE